MTNQALDILKLLLLGLLYAFFGRVLWTVWTEVREPARTANTRSSSAGAAPARTPRQRSKQRRGIPTSIAVIMPKERRGPAVAIGDGLRIGREADNGIVIDYDPYASGYHAKVSPYEGGVVVNDLASRNGTLLNGSPLTDQRLIHPGDRIQIGTTVLEAR
ncbi:MAG: hypothetical protein CSA55_05070 [Ilumatobacter coccineus]|uniref:FHA domain-containing protein n=1 Tax=Ilumatobacter coccineus TaxID=467094 RepID=A0A2G6K7W4_9ACTN|nr:MAG: hypothetical protein CSA55_05070 [Ilumatobacter coccineus]